MTTPVVVRRPDVPEPSMHEARVTRRLRQLRRDALREVTRQRLRWRRALLFCDDGDDLDFQQEVGIG